MPQDIIFRKKKALLLTDEDFDKPYTKGYYEIIDKIKSMRPLGYHSLVVLSDKPFEKFPTDIRRIIEDWRSHHTKEGVMGQPLRAWIPCYILEVLGAE